MFQSDDEKTSIQRKEEDEFSTSFENVFEKMMRNFNQRMVNDLKRGFIGFQKEKNAIRRESSITSTSNADTDQSYYPNFRERSEKGRPKMERKEIGTRGDVMTEMQGHVQPEMQNLFGKVEKESKGFQFAQLHNSPKKIAGSENQIKNQSCFDRRHEQIRNIIAEDSIPLKCEAMMGSMIAYVVDPDLQALLSAEVVVVPSVQTLKPNVLKVKNGKFGLAFAKLEELWKKWGDIELKKLRVMKEEKIVMSSAPLSENRNRLEEVDGASMSLFGKENSFVKKESSLRSSEKPMMTMVVTREFPSSLKVMSEDVIAELQRKAICAEPAPASNENEKMLMIGFASSLNMTSKDVIAELKRKAISAEPSFGISGVIDDPKKSFVHVSSMKFCEDVSLPSSLKCSELMAEHLFKFRKKSSPAELIKSFPSLGLVSILMFVVASVHAACQRFAMDDVRQWMPPRRWMLPPQPD
jgi:hypothetical protein